MKNCETIEKVLQMSSEDRAKASRVVARSFFKMLRRNGFSQGEIMNFTGHLLDEVIRDMKLNGEKQQAWSESRPEPAGNESVAETRNW